jgi:hypothetical protein
MDSATNPTLFSKRKKRSTEKMAIDVNGGRPNVNYNDKFLNPAEFAASSDLNGLSEHLQSSISLLEESLNTIFPTVA